MKNSDIPLTLAALMGARTLFRGLSREFSSAAVGAQWELRQALAFADQGLDGYDFSAHAHVDPRCPRVTALLGCFSNQ